MLRFQKLHRLGYVLRLGLLFLAWIVRGRVGPEKFWLERIAIWELLSLEDIIPLGAPRFSSGFLVNIVVSLQYCCFCFVGSSN